MLGLIFNLSFGEILVVLVLSVLIFGGRLPEVAARAVHYGRKFRRGLDDLRRETGIDREIRNIEYEIRDAERQARRENPFPPQPPAGLRQARKTPGEAVSGASLEAEPGPGEGVADAPQGEAAPASDPAAPSDPESSELHAQD